MISVPVAAGTRATTPGTRVPTSVVSSAVADAVAAGSKRRTTSVRALPGSGRAPRSAKTVL